MNMLKFLGIGNREHREQLMDAINCLRPERLLTWSSFGASEWSPMHPSEQVLSRFTSSCLCGNFIPLPLIRQQTSCASNISNSSVSLSEGRGIFQYMGSTSNPCASTVVSGCGSTRSGFPALAYVTNMDESVEADGSMASYSSDDSRRSARTAYSLGIGSNITSTQQVETFRLEQDVGTIPKAPRLNSYQSVASEGNSSKKNKAVKCRKLVVTLPTNEKA